MRLLRLSSRNELSLTEDLSDNVPPYAILSHTWGSDNDEVTYSDVKSGRGQSKAGYAKIQFYGERARGDKIEYFWVDTCCINKDNLVELSEAITSMFRWYCDAVKCYVYLSDVSAHERDDNDQTQLSWEASFRSSRWFTRGWTLQELLAPSTVEFFSRENKLLGEKSMLAQQIHKITKIPIAALYSTPLPRFSIAERMRWAEKRNTKKKEDKAYCLMGVFQVFMPLIYGEGDNAFRRLQKKINERYGLSAKSAHVHWMVPRTTNPLFTGREDLLQELDDIVRGAVNDPWDQAPCQIVISGMGGQGKSEVCLQLARRLRHLFWAVFWVDISTRDMAERSFLDIAQKLSIPAQSWEDARLGIANLKHPWLLVLDNADEPDVDYQDYFPDRKTGVVVMTTRNNECQRYGISKVICLAGLQDDDARDLLLKAARVPPSQQSAHETDARRVTHLLKSHPLALIQAGAYVARGHCPLAEYPRLYERQRQRLLTYRPVQAQSRYGDVYATFQVSARMLNATTSQSACDALQLLSLLAVCGPSRLPLFLFEAGWRGAKGVPSDLDETAEDENVQLLTPWHVAHLPSLLDTTSDTWDSFRLMEAVTLLKAFALVSTQTHGRVIYVSTHTLIHAWARDRQDNGKQHHSWLQMGCVMAVALDHGSIRQEQRRQFQPHVEAFTEWDITKIIVVDSPILIIRVLKIFTWLGVSPIQVEGPLIGLYHLTALNLIDYGLVKEAVALLEAVVKIREQSLAEDHPDRLASQHALAGAYEANGQVKEAVVLLEAVVKIEEQSLAEDHPDRLASQHNLATYLWRFGEYSAALTLMARVVELQKHVLDDDHSNRQSSEAWLAYLKHEMGESEIA